MILDKPLYLWNKDNKKHLYFEVDSCDDGWTGVHVHFNMRLIISSMPKPAKLICLAYKRPKRIIAWISKAWTPYEKQSLPIFYKETIARLLTFEQWRNLVKTQEEGHGINNLLF
jgi:hypothetical protein